MKDFQLKAYKIFILHKEKIKRWHDAKILKLEFRVGDDMHLFNSILKLFVEKLKSKWPSLFMVSNVILVERLS